LTTYRNARTTTLEVLGITLVIPVVILTIALLAIGVSSTNFYLGAIWIYLLVAGNSAFFLWDTRNVPHTIILEEDKLVAKTRAGEQEIQWENIEDLLWKKVVAKRAVIGMYMKDDREVWLRSVRPQLAKAIESRWKKV